jgi:RNA polymerase sigma-70 factor (ECF subfamily)
MEAFLDGDARAFDALYRRLSPKVAALLRYLSGDARAAEDLCQTTFLKVCRARDTWLRGAPVEPWVYAIARRTLIDHRRRARRNPVHGTADGELPELLPEGIDPVYGFERLTDSKRVKLLGTLDKLPDNQRDALLLTKVEGLSTAQAAAVLGTTPGAIKLRAHRAYENLRRALGLKSPRKAAP